MRVREYMCACAGVALLCSNALVLYTSAEVFHYPQARRNECVVDDYHGVMIRDPYRWLEDPNSRETKKFIEAQNNITRPFLDACPERKNILERMKTLHNHEKVTCPMRHGSRYYFYKIVGLQNQPTIFVQDTLESEPRVFLDVNTLSEDGTVAVAQMRFSEDGSKFAYALSAGGSDWHTVHVKDADTGEDYPDVLKNVKFSELAWTIDNNGFFYSGYLDQTSKPSGKADSLDTEMNKNHKLYYHRLNTPQSHDVMVAEFPDEPLWLMTADVSSDGRYLLVSVIAPPHRLLFVADLGLNPKVTGKLPLEQIVHKLDAEYGYISNEGSMATFLTNKDAPNYRLVKINLAHPRSDEHWESLVPEHPSDVLKFAVAADNDKLILLYYRDVKAALQVHNLKTGALLQSLELDVPGSVAQLFAKRDHHEMFFFFWSFLYPGIIYYVDFRSPAPYKLKVLKKVKLKGYNAALFETNQIFYTSKDGTKIPMFISSKKGLARNSENPTLLLGYGGFNVNMDPGFDIMQLVFMQNLGGVVAVANIRGGGEYGVRWYDAGRLLNKQNVFDDFQAAAEYLIAKKYTRPGLLTVQGAYNGGLLVAACINQRPELFGAAIIQNGVLDMLRYQKFTVGFTWVAEYGSSDNLTHFDNLIEYSPLHNIQPTSNERVQYPATLVMTADHDDHVVPLHSLKFIAALQYALRDQRQQHPLLARIDTKTGYEGEPTVKIIEDDTDILCFITQALTLKFTTQT